MVYVIQADIGGPIKIGYTGGTADDRLRALQCGSPFPLRVIATYPFGTAEDERDLHDYFKAARLHGEWFDFTDEIGKWLANLLPAFPPLRLIADPSPGSRSVATERRNRPCYHPSIERAGT